MRREFVKIPTSGTWMRKLEPQANLADYVETKDHAKLAPGMILCPERS